MAQSNLVNELRSNSNKQHNAVRDSSTQPIEQQLANSLSNQHSDDISTLLMGKKATAERNNFNKSSNKLVASQQQSIDAGIELDCSSNSESSVKDPTEEQQQIKSASVSPVMAQSNLIEELDCNGTKHAVEDSPIEQLTGSLCTDIAMSKKIGLTNTKQQLAANQQVIDADEQSLQQKLQSKQQRKSSVQSNSTSNSAKSLNGAGGGGGGATSAAAAATTTATATTPTTTPTTTTTTAGQLGGTPQTLASCKVCQQHVYQMERMMAEKAVYHKSCFRCYQCKIQLRVDNYSSHEGQVYCKAHHRKLFQPQVKLDNEDDVDIVAKSTSKPVDDYLLHRGRLSDLSYSFLRSKPEEIRKRQMIICENEPAKLPEDVVRSDSKVDDGLNYLSLNLGNIKERFERGTAANDDSNSQPSSAGIVIEKPSFNIKKTLMAFETKSVNNNSNNIGDTSGDDSKRPDRVERPVVKKLTNIGGIFGRQNSDDSESSSSVPPQTTRPLSVRRSESLMMRLRKYESRIAGDQVIDDDDDDDDNNNHQGGDDENNNRSATAGNKTTTAVNGRSENEKSNTVPKKLASIDLSTLKSQWENGDISRRSAKLTDDMDSNNESNGMATSDMSPSSEKEDELIRVRQQLARKKSSGGSSSIKNIYENAIKEAQTQRAAANKLISSDLSALNGFSTLEIQQQLLQNGSASKQNSSTPSATPSKDHFQLNLSNKANKLRERFEQGLINNNSHDDSDSNDDDAGGGGGGGQPALSKLEQLRQEKMDDLDWLSSRHEGEIKAREARSMFQQIDRRLSNGQALPTTTTRPLTSSMSAPMQKAKLQQHQQSQQTATDSAGPPPPAAAAAAANGSRRADTMTNGRTESGGMTTTTTRANCKLAKGRSQPARLTAPSQ